MPSCGFIAIYRDTLIWSFSWQNWGGEACSTAPGGGWTPLPAEVGSGDIQE